MGEILVFSRSDVDAGKVDVYMHISCGTASSTTPKCQTICVPRCVGTHPAMSHFLLVHTKMYQCALLRRQLLYQQGVVSHTSMENTNFHTKVHFT
jgi:hypothetical protein